MPSRLSMESGTAMKPSSNITDIVHRFAQVCRLRSVGVFSEENPSNHTFEDSSDATFESKETEEHEDDDRKVHPQPTFDESSLNQNQEAMEAFVSKLFADISSLKAAYIELQAAHTPYDPEKIQYADKLVISELKNLSQLKHFYRDNNPKPPPPVSPRDSRLVAEIREQQSLLKTYEVMVKKFRAQIQTRDSEILQLQQLIHDSSQRGAKLERKLKQRGLIEDWDSEESILHSMELTPNLFSAAVESVSLAAHDFSKPLINMMKAVGWDLDAAASSIDPDIVYAKRAHKKYAFESYVCQRMFHGFQEESFYVKAETETVHSNEGFFHQFLGIRAMDPLDVLSQDPDSVFGEFCRSKYLLLVHPKMESSFFGNLDQRNHVLSGGHPRTPFYQAFLKLAKSVWILHRLAFSFDPQAEIFQVRKGTEFLEMYMESVVKNLKAAAPPKVGFTVMPGFRIGDTVIRCQVYLSGMESAE